jgi:hypothetical protein
MPQPPLSEDVLRQAYDLVVHHRNITAAAKSAGVNRVTFDGRWRQAVIWAERQGLPIPELVRTYRPSVATAQAPVVSTRTSDTLKDAVLGSLKTGGAAVTLAELANRHDATPGACLDALLAIQATGVNLHEINGAWSVERMVPAGTRSGVAPYMSRPDGSYVFGVMGDSHLGSKYERLDVLRDLYRKFAAAGVDRVFHTGNWIDGEARFNKFDLKVHGMERQLDYCIEQYPNVGIETFAVTGDDHEGWYAQREGVDIGRLLESRMRDAGRTDWHNLGYMEAYVPLQHAQTGKSSMLHCIHPGGGSSYATSYTVQKIVESYEGGNKPAVLLAGHYHKLEFINVRNVWCVQTGCQQDQTPFARKKKLHYAVGGGIMRLTQNPETGAIEHAGVDLFCYFDRGYYENNRWSMSGDVVLPRRIA